MDILNKKQYLKLDNRHVQYKVNFKQVIVIYVIATDIRARPNERVASPLESIKNWLELYYTQY